MLNRCFAPAFRTTSLNKKRALGFVDVKSNILRISSICLAYESQTELSITIGYNLFMTIVRLTIIPRVRVGYEMVDSQRGAQRLVGYDDLISNKREWNNCFIKNAQKNCNI